MALLETPVCDFTVKVPGFKLKDYAGKEYSLQQNFWQNPGKEALLVMFICNHCPYVKAVLDRLVSDAKELQEIGVEVVAVMPNDYESYPDDSPGEMLDFAREHGFTFPYLIDEGQDVAKSFDAVCTPDFFGFNKNGMLRYRGRIDDLGIRGGDLSNRKAELLDAMRMVVETGEGPKEQVPSMGCSIKWKVL